MTGSAITIPSSINPSLAQGITIRGNDPSFSNPVSYSTDLTVEQELPLRTTLTIGYVGNRANHLPIFIDTNVDPTSVLNNRFTATPTRSRVWWANYNQPNLCEQDRLCGGQCGDWLLGCEFLVPLHGGHGPQADVARSRAPGELHWAHAMDTGQTPGGNGTFNGTDAAIIPFFTGGRTGVGDEYARSDLDIRSRVVLTLIGKSDFKLGNRAERYAINGWQISGTYTAQSGEPGNGDREWRVHLHFRRRSRHAWSCDHYGFRSGERLVHLFHDGSFDVDPRSGLRCGAQRVPWPGRA